MAELKTKENDASVEALLNAVENEAKKAIDIFCFIGNSFIFFSK